LSGDCWPKSISEAERLSALACEKPARRTSREPTRQLARIGPSLLDELAAVSEKVRAQEPLGAIVRWFAETCAQVVLARVSLAGERDGPLSRVTVNVCAALLKLVTARMRVAVCSRQ
jgi:hypothetical protein